jgi:DNA-binding CsgD family transcriptional regulator
MRLAGREDALTALTAVLDDAHVARGGIAVVHGGVTVGKSALLDAFTQQAVAAGGVALTAVGSAAERAVPLGLIGQLVLDAQQRNGDELAGLRSLADCIPLAGADADSAAVLRVAQTMCAAVLELARRRAVALVLDDAHHADAASVTCLSYLARRMRGARITAVYAFDDHPVDQSSDFRSELLRQPYSRAVPLAPLDRDAVARIAVDRLGPQEAERVATHAHVLTGGNPLLVQGLLSDHRAALRSVTAGDTPALRPAEGYAGAVLLCLRRGRAPMHEVAQALAVLGDRELAHRLLDLDATVTAQALRGLEAAGLLADGAFRHPAAAAAVLAALPRERRVSLSAKAAELMHAEGRAPARIADQLLSARTVREPWAAAVLEEAAASVLVQGEVATAVEYLRLAGESCDDKPALPRIKTALMRAQWRVDPALAATHLDDLVAFLPSGHLHAGDAVTLARALLWHGRFETAAPVLDYLRAADTPEAVAELRIAHTWVRCSYPPLSRHLEQEGPQDPQPLSAAGFPALDAAATAGAEAGRRLDAAAALDLVLSGGPVARAVREAERILRGTRLEGMSLDAVEAALLALTYADQTHRAAPWCEELIGVAAARRAPAWQAVLTAIRAELCLRQGDLPSARRHALASLESIAHGGWGVAVGAALSSLLAAQTAMGRYDEAAQTLQRPVPEAMLQTRFGLQYVHARGRYNLSTGRYGRALADFEACGALMIRWDLDAPGLVAWRIGAAEAWLELGDRDRARDIVQQQLERLDSGGGSSPRARGQALRVLAATCESRRRPPLLRKAADVLHACGDRYGFARALADLADSYYALGESRRARVIGRQALTTARACSAEPLVRRLTGDGPAADGSSQALAAGLSDAERRVAGLVALGLTNRQIAKRLFVTVSTVEQHLTHAYRRLGIDNRAQLASLVCAEPRPASLHQVR